MVTQLSEVAQYVKDEIAKAIEEHDRTQTEKLDRIEASFKELVKDEHEKARLSVNKELKDLSEKQEKAELNIQTLIDQVRQVQAEMEAMQDDLIAPQAGSHEAPQAAPEVHLLSPTPMAEADAQQRVAAPEEHNVPWPTPTEARARQIAEGRNLGMSLDGAADRMDPELKKNVWDRKGFDKRLSKFSNEKGSQEFKDWSYELRRVTVSDPNFHSFLRWLEEEKLEGTQGAVTEQVLENLGAKTGWKVGWLNSQLYGILAEASSGRAKNSVMAQEHQERINGATLYRAFAHEHLDGFQKATVSLGVKITKPAMASMDEFEDRLRTYDQDLERYERLSEQKVGELAFVHLQDMIPQEVRARFDNESTTSPSLCTSGNSSAVSSRTTKQVPRRRRSRH